MNVYLFAAVFVTVVSGTSLRDGYDSYSGISNPCGYEQSGGSTIGERFSQTEESETTSTKELIHDFVILLKEGKRETKRIMTIYRSKTHSRLRQLMTQRHTNRLFTYPDMPPSILKSFDTNLQLDYNVLAETMLFLKEFKPTYASVDELHRKIASLLCRNSELLMKEGRELSPLPSVLSLYGPRRHMASMLINEYRMLMDIKDYFTKAINLYRIYSKNI